MSDIVKKFSLIQESAKRAWDEFMHSPRPKIFVGCATCGVASGALEVFDTLKRELNSLNIDAELVKVGCIGLCYAEPIVEIMLPPMPRVSFGNVSREIAVLLVKEFIMKRNILKEWAIGVYDKNGVDGVPYIFDHPMMKKQVRIVLKNCGIIDPENILHYIAVGGYEAFAKALQMFPEEVVDIIEKSQLRGRGGAGFPTAKKWKICKAQSEKEKYLICNFDEGDPGAFMNRTTVESDPHLLLEGILIAGYAIGATEGYIYVRAEYPLAIQRLRVALKQAKDFGFVGKNILGSDFSFEIKIVEGAGAFVCGEETALIQSIEGKRGMPYPRPPYPAVVGLRGKPTVVNNVETLSTIPHIIKNGAEWFLQYGTEKSKGTKTFSLAGKVKRTGLIEVPMGIKLREIVYDIGGGTIEDKKFKAIQTGGPSGGCLPVELLDLEVDYEKLTKAGSMMGSGGIIVMDEDTCIVDIAHYFLNFTSKESCGKCVPCRIGTKHMLSILEKIKGGKANGEDITKLNELAVTVKKTSLCGLGQTAPNPVLTTLKYFFNEYEIHVKEKKCPANVCKL